VHEPCRCEIARDEDDDAADGEHEQLFFNRGLDHASGEVCKSTESQHEPDLRDIIYDDYNDSTMGSYLPNPGELRRVSEERRPDVRSGRVALEAP
jgi:hypothetical protein